MIFGYLQLFVFIIMSQILIYKMTDSPFVHVVFKQKWRQHLHFYLLKNSRDLFIR